MERNDEHGDDWIVCDDCHGEHEAGTPWCESCGGHGGRHAMPGDADCEPFDGPHEAWVQLAQIRMDGDTQSRDGTDADTEEEYAERYRAGVRMPPVELFFDGGQYWPADGHHRIAGARLAGFGDITAIVRHGGREDAALASCSANTTHGLKRTRADKRSAVRRCILLRPQWSNRRVAEHCGVSDKTVKPIRGEMEARAEIPHLGSRVGTDGKSYPAQQPSPSPAADASPGALGDASSSPAPGDRPGQPLPRIECPDCHRQVVADQGVLRVHRGRDGAPSHPVHGSGACLGSGRTMEAADGDELDEPPEPDPSPLQLAMLRVFAQQVDPHWPIPAALAHCHLETELDEDVPKAVFDEMLRHGMFELGLWVVRGGRVLLCVDDPETFAAPAGETTPEGEERADTTEEDDDAADERSAPEGPGAADRDGEPEEGSRAAQPPAPERAEPGAAEKADAEVGPSEVAPGADPAADAPEVAARLEPDQPYKPAQVRTAWEQYGRGQGEVTDAHWAAVLDAGIAAGLWELDERDQLWLVPPEQPATPATSLVLLAITPQPAPIITTDSVSVVDTASEEATVLELPDELLELLEARREVGIEEYGDELCSYNGRSARVDQLQESLDGLLYAIQEYIEATTGPEGGRDCTRATGRCHCDACIPGVAAQHRVWMWRSLALDLAAACKEAP